MISEDVYHNGFICIGIIWNPGGALNKSAAGIFQSGIPAVHF